MASFTHTKQQCKLRYICLSVCGSLLIILGFYLIILPNETQDHIDQFTTLSKTWISQFDKFTKTVESLFESEIVASSSTSINNELHSTFITPEWSNNYLDPDDNASLSSDYHDLPYIGFTTTTSSDFLRISTSTSSLISSNDYRVVDFSLNMYNGLPTFEFSIPLVEYREGTVICEDVDSQALSSKYCHCANESKYYYNYSTKTCESRALLSEVGLTYDLSLNLFDIEHVKYSKSVLSCDSKNCYEQNSTDIDVPIDFTIECTSSNDPWNYYQSLNRSFGVPARVQLAVAALSFGVGIVLLSVSIFLIRRSNHCHYLELSTEDGNFLWHYLKGGVSLPRHNSASAPEVTSPSEHLKML